MARFQAALGMFSPLHAVRVRVQRMNKRVDRRRTYVFIEPPGFARTLKARNSAISLYEIRQMIGENRYSSNLIR